MGGQEPAHPRLRQTSTPAVKSPTLKVYLGHDGGKDISTWISRLDYEDTSTKDSKLTLSIYQERYNDLLDDAVIQKKGDIYFQFGFLEGPMSEMHRAKITDVNVEYGAVITITLVSMDRGNVMKKSSSNKVWKKKTTKEIATEIAGRYGLELDMPFNGKTWDSLPQGHKSDMDFLRNIVTREKDGKYRMFIRNNVLYVAERGTGKASVQTFTYKADQSMLSFKVSWKEASKDSAKTKKVKVGPDGKPATPDKQTDTSTDDRRVSISSEGVASALDQFGESLSNSTNLLGIGSGSASTNTPPTTSTPGILDAFKSTVSPLVDSILGKNVPTATKDTGEASDLGHSLQNKATHKVITGDLTIEGNPLLKPDQVITISGVHVSHAGNWYIQGLKHSVSKQEYITNVDLSRNAAKVGGVKADKANKTVGPDQKENTVKNYIIGGSSGTVLSVDSENHSSPL